MVEGGVISFIRSDPIGRPVFATNNSGVKVWTAAYLPFGGVRVATGTPPTARFPGQWFQSETGLHQNWMRDYDPTTGRYMQADPLGLVDGASVYGYARQSPGRYVDPRGEFVFGAIFGAAGSFGLQFLINVYVGGMSLSDAAKCVDMVAVMNGAIIGGFGYGPLGLAIKGQFGDAVGWLGAGYAANHTMPNIRVGEIMGEECNCKITDAPAWATTALDFVL